MSISCCHTPESYSRDERYRRVLWLVLGINAAMFVVEVVAGWIANSTSLQADSLDFLADATNYGFSLLVVGMSLRYRATTALVKGASMGLFGVWVLANTLWYAVQGTVPKAITMGAIGAAALSANVICLVLLWAYRAGDSNMRSVWLCSRNDVIGNFAVLLAALGVFGTGTGWPDVIVASIMGMLALRVASLVVRQATAELDSLRPAAIEREVTVFQPGMCCEKDECDA
jgi:Co/Zn/Cd efflux system component